MEQVAQVETVGDGASKQEGKTNKNKVPCNQVYKFVFVSCIISNHHLPTKRLSDGELAVEKKKKRENIVEVNFFYFFQAHQTVTSLAFYTSG